MCVPDTTLGISAGPAYLQLPVRSFKRLCDSCNVPPPKLLLLGRQKTMEQITVWTAVKSYKAEAIVYSRERAVLLWQGREGT